MTKTPIKHMTYEQAGAEDKRLSALSHELDLKIWPLNDRADYFDHLFMLWMKRMAATARRLTDLARMEEPPKGEIPRLVEINKVYFARYQQRIRQRNAEWDKRGVLFAEKDKISRRQKHVTKRGWETFGPRDRNRITTLWLTPRAVDLETAS